MARIPSRFIRKLTLKEKRQLEKLCRKRSSQIRERARIISLSAQDVPIGEIVKRVGLSRQSVFFWLNRFEDFGIDGLETQPRPGRPITFTKDIGKDIVRIATSKPKDLGLNFTTWSLPKLKDYLIRHKIVDYICIESVRTCLYKGGLTLKSAQKWMVSRDPHFAEKKTH